MSKFCGTQSKQKHSIETFIQNVEPCQTHNRRCQFVCLEKQCQHDLNLLLCTQCIVNHNSHQFQTLESYFLKNNNYEHLEKGQSKKHKHFDDLSKLVKKKLSQIESNVVSGIESIRKGMDASMQRLKQVGIKGLAMDQKIDNEMMLSIVKYLENEWTYVRCQKMKQCFDKVLNAIDDSFTNINEDLLTFIQDQDWQQILQPQYSTIEERYFHHMHNHKQKVLDYFKFDMDQKAPNIKIKDGRLHASYMRMSPSTPFVVCDNIITPEKNKWTIEIQQCENKMLFFNASTIYIGVCKPDVAKRMGFTQLNEGGRGSYLVGSNGWSYHHTNPNLDRQDIVGFTFGKGDKIQVQTIFDNKRGVIKFKKVGKIYDNKFQMILDLDQKQMKNLKPCVGFHDQIGVDIKIINS